MYPLRTIAPVAGVPESGGETVSWVCPPTAAIASMRQTSICEGEAPFSTAMIVPGRKFEASASCTVNCVADVPVRTVLPATARMSPNMAP